MLPFRKIVVALARRETDTGLLNYARMLAGRSGGAQLHCVHICDPSVDPEPLRNGLECTVRNYFRDQSQENVACHVLAGERTDSLLTFAIEQSPDLILLGHAKNRSGRRSLARRLAMQAPCSIWMIPEGSPASLRTILVPVDLSRRAADALSLATLIAQVFGIPECLALHVYFNEATVTYDEYQQVLADETGEAFWIFVSRVDLHDVDAKPVLVEAPNVAETINRIAAERGADLIVMGTRGRSRSAAVLLGSETEHTIINARIPVLAVKHFGARRRLIEVLLDRRRPSRRGVPFA